MPLKKVRFFYEDSEVVQMAESLKTKGKLSEFEPFIKGLTLDELNILLGRKKALKTFHRMLNKEKYWLEYLNEIGEADTKEEKAWQCFFERNDWIFGFGLQMRFLQLSRRELPIPTENLNRMIVDFLLQSDYTAIAEIKSPSTKLFGAVHNRSGAWRLSLPLLDAISQVLEQKIEWQGYAHQNREIYDEFNNKIITKRTRDSKAYLIVGNKSKELDESSNGLEREEKADTLELLRQSLRNIEIITYDELFERSSVLVNGMEDIVYPETKDEMIAVPVAEITIDNEW
jgi:hypothetical protein